MEVCFVIAIGSVVKSLPERAAYQLANRMVGGQAQMVNIS